MDYQDKQIIDGYFGAGMFDDWTEWQRCLQTEKKRYKEFVTENFSKNDDGLMQRIQLADNIRADLEIGFRYILQGKKIDKKEIEKHPGIFELITNTAEQEIDIFQAVNAAGVIKGMLVPFVRMFPQRQLKAELTVYETEMKIVQQNLELAKQQRIEAVMDKIIDITGLVIELIPEVALTKKAAFSLFALIADNNLGPQQPSGYKIGRTGGSIFAEPLVEDLGKFGAGMGKLANIGGKINALYDAANFSELAQANKTIADIEASLKMQKQLHEILIKEIWFKWEHRIMMLENQLRQVQRNISSDKNETIKMRNEIDTEISKARYNSPKAWIILS